MLCSICNSPLKGKQTKFCSTKCKNKDINHRHKDYDCQSRRGLSRKLKLVKLLGGKCSICGYKLNYAVLNFHHLRDKSFGIDLRQCSNRSWKVLLNEANKCQLLCCNCHQELHHPNCKM